MRFISGYAWTLAGITVAIGIVAVSVGSVSFGLLLLGGSAASLYLLHRDRRKFFNSKQSHERQPEQNP